MHVDESPEKATIVLHDGDTKFVEGFKAVTRADGIRTKRVTPISRNLNAYAERFIQTIKQECLDHFVVLGERICSIS
jgi:putative transposase